MKRLNVVDISFELGPSYNKIMKPKVTQMMTDETGLSDSFSYDETLQIFSFKILR